MKGLAAFSGQAASSGKGLDVSGNSVRLYFLGLQNHCKLGLQP